jgi:hypothetical protein
MTTIKNQDSKFENPTPSVQAVLARYQRWSL